ncbi:des-methyl-DIF-1 methyltransferase [Tieghemostelium lacteum]|uniref:Des-methyl-DIF-1 methyltransferase n=1 Tax=Tieghemostelium lacteum TaxID=361077 RepID=A0A152A2E7_TIELA|nr:des-methyl-DIF-1 methyltransferase [Tieghemostelium lacteum]|eukprot:KYR00241.1 des-methyl-DIF-1 methyltransferase [Tieghemostelium lacteum]
MELHKYFNGYRICKAINVMVRFEVPRRLGNSLESKRSSDDIAKEIGCHAEALYRLMRALASEGIFKEIIDPKTPRLFQHTQMSLDLSDPCFQGELFMHTGTGHYKSMETLPETIMTGKSQCGKAFNEESYWHALAKDKNIENELTIGMSSLSSRQFNEIVQLGNFDQFEIVCDLGGCEGVLMKNILDNCPKVKKGINFDQPHVIKNIMEKQGVISSDPRYSQVGGSFFESVPEADCYTMKWIIHDWNDEKSIQILNTIAKSIKPGGKVYIIDYILSEDDMNSDHYKFIVWLDIFLLHLCEGKERTKKELLEIVSHTPFKVDSYLFPKQKLVLPITVLSLK